MNEDSKALYHELVTNKIIHTEIKEDHDNELTKEIDWCHLDKERNRRFKPTYQQ